MSTISKKDVEHTANLARLALNEEEKEKFTQELVSILDYVNQLQKVDTAKVDFAPEVPPPGAGNLRADEPVDSGIQEAILSQAPKRKDKFFEVKAVLEE